MLQRTLFVLLCSVSGLTTRLSADEFRFQDNDRVVLLGDALIEQEQYFGWVECMLTAAQPDQHLTFRNLGWSADTPAGDSRFGLSLLQAGREPADEGWKQLVKQLELTKPTVMILGYGMASALEGGLSGDRKFIEDYQRLLKEARRITPEVRFVFVSPLLPLDSDNRSFAAIKAYASIVKSLAKKYSSPYVDLTDVARDKNLRRDDIHLNSGGYKSFAVAMQKALQLPESGWQTKKETEALRDVILRKNQWWFHRSRPANVAYVFGFRKREQGQNAVEIPKFDGLVAEEEQRIAKLRSLNSQSLPEPEPRLKSEYAKFVRQPTPEFTVADDWEVTLWAENPSLNKPIQINFDPQGRLWVASSEAYPMIEVGQSAPDKILVLEDTDQDGKADKSTVFADGLLIPTGVEPGNGGCYVAQSTDLLFLKDTDGDGKADQKTRVLNGFGTEDTHHNLHTLRWGPDGRLYMNQSVYTRTDAETPRGVMRLKAGGGFRFNPNTMRMEIFFRGLWNSWGHQFDAYGQSFATDGAGFAGVAYLFPGVAFNPAPKTRRVMDLISPGRYPKFCSMEITYGDNYPPEWQGSIVTCDFRANRVTRFSLSDQGAGFVTKQEDDLMRTSAATFRPIDVKQGPDGALYIADWSNPIINHGEVDFRDERRDRWHGRIWRAVWKGGKRKPIEDLTKLPDDQLLENLKSNNRYTRDQSRRVLIERGEKTAPAVVKWTANQTNELDRLQGVWLIRALDWGNDELLFQLISAKDPRVRAAVLRIYSSDLADPKTDSKWAISSDLALRTFKAAILDENPRVRLEVVRGLGKLGTPEAAAAALTVLDMPRDRFIDFALATTLDELTPQFVAMLNRGDWKPDTPEKQKQLEFALTSIQPDMARQYLARYLKTNALPPDGFSLPRDGDGIWIELIGKAGGSDELLALYKQAVGGGFNGPATARALNALIESANVRKVRPKATQGVEKLLAAENNDVKATAIRLIGAWRLRGQAKTIANLVVETQEAPIKHAGIDAMRQLGGDLAVKTLTSITQSGDALGFRQHALMALAALKPDRAVDPFYALLPEFKDQQQCVDVWRGMLSKKETGKLIANKMPGDGISDVAVRAGLLVAREAGRKEPALVAKLSKFSGQSMKAEKLTPQRLKQLLILTAKADAHRGESVYRRKDLACVSCHAIGGVGGKVGPDMTSLGASAPIDYIIQSLYEPNAKIKENYHSVIVATDDGIKSGIEVSSSDEELVIRDASNKLIRIPVADIVGKKAGKSLMPVGVINRLSDQEQADLIRFLTQLGKPGDFDAAKGGVGRVYEILAGDHRVEQNHGPKVISGEYQKGWQPLTSMVSGNVPGATLKEMTKTPFNISLVNIYLRTKVQASNDGAVTFNVKGPKSADLWIDGKPVEGDTTFKSDLTAGDHTVLVRLDARDVPENFQLRSSDVSFAVE